MLSSYLTNDELNIINLYDEEPETVIDMLKNGRDYYKILKTKQISGIPLALLSPDFPRSKNNNQYILIQGTVIRSGEPFYKNKDYDLTCTRCNKNYFTKNYKNFICENCGCDKFLVKQNFERSIKCQSIWVQDIGNISTLSETIEVELEKENVGKYLPGEKINVFGFVSLKFKNLKQNKKFGILIYIKAHTIQKINSYKSIFLNQIDVNQDHTSEFKKQKYFLELFCNEIEGLVYAKLALFITIIGGNSTENRRSNSHILLVGDPGTGKTHLLQFVSKIVTPSVFINGLGTSEAGLTTCAIKSGQEWSIEAGALVMADNGICCIDCFDMLKVSERGGLLEVMEQQTLSVAKAGIVASLNARCNIVGTYNTNFKYNKSKSISENLKISSPLLSRFDLLILLRDQKKDDLKKSSKILNLKTTQYEEKQKKMEISIQIRQYVQSVKNKRVEMTENGKNLISKYYKILYKNKKTTIRSLEALTRLSEAHAKFLDSQNVEKFNVISVIILFESSLLGSNLLDIDFDKVFLDEEYFTQISEKLYDIIMKS